jgi:hypothetical protein
MKSIGCDRGSRQITPSVRSQPRQILDELRTRVREALAATAPELVNEPNRVWGGQLDQE